MSEDLNRPVTLDELVKLTKILRGCIGGLVGASIWAGADRAKQQDYLEGALDHMTRLERAISEMQGKAWEGDTDV
jgi:hypothetical protein